MLGARTAIRHHNDGVVGDTRSIHTSLASTIPRDLLLRHCCPRFLGNLIWILKDVGGRRECVRVDKADPDRGAAVSLAPAAHRPHKLPGGLPFRHVLPAPDRSPRPSRKFSLNDALKILRYLGKNAASTSCWATR